MADLETVHATIDHTGITGVGGGAFVGAKVYKTSQSISNAVLAFDNEVYDTDGFHDNVTNNSRLTVPTGKTGKYLAQASSWTSLTTCRMSIYVNGSIIRGAGGMLSSGNYTMALAVLDLVATDYVEVFGATAASTTYGDNGTIGDNTVFSLTKL